MSLRIDDLNSMLMMAVYLREEAEKHGLDGPAHHAERLMYSLTCARKSPDLHPAGEPRTVQ